MTEKPQDKTTEPASEPTETDPEAGKLGVDDRGNITWQWKGSGDVLLDDALGEVERIRALLDPTLAVSEDEDFPAGPVGDGPTARKASYNPYQRDGVAKKPQRGKKKDLKQLSDWIELRKKVTAKKKDV